MAPIMITSHPHLDLEQWLNVLDLQQYSENFKKFNGVEELMYFCEADIKQLGVRNSAHRARIVSSLVALRDKWERGNVNSNNNSLKRNGSTKRPNRYSMPADTNRKSTDSSTQQHYELLTVNDKSTKQSKSLGDLFEMESGSNSTAGTPTSQESQETLALKKALEWELSLDSRDLKSHAWYHGPIPRTRAEEIVQKDGDFLIRDCVSQPGNYVLTCKAKGAVLHFVINKILIQPETVYERAQYQFEDDAYDTVADLITFYVGSGKPISAASGARIQFPCNRMYPLSFYVSKYGAQITGNRGASPLNSPSLVNAGLRYNPYKEQGNYNSFRSPMSSPPRTKRETPPRLPSKKQRSQSLTPIQQQNQTNSTRGSHEKYCSADGVIQGNCVDVNGTQIRQSESRRLNLEKCGSADGVIQNPTDNIMTRSAEDNLPTNDSATNHHQMQSQTMSRSTGDPLSSLKFSSLPRTPSGNVKQSLLHTSRTSSFNRESSDPSLSPCLEQRNFTEDDENEAPSPPPKPARTPSMMRHDVKDQDHGPIQRVASYHASGSDSGNGSGDSAQSSAAGDPLELQHRGVVIKNPKYLPNSSSSITLKSFVEIDPIAVEESLQTMDILVFEQSSKFDLENFHTLLLPSIENKPLDNGALNTFRMMLSETGPRVLANHLTRIDIRLILGDLDLQTIKQQTEINPLETTGIELITLEHGKQFRRDLIERTECLKLLVATTILTCQSDSERAETLNKWIQVAVDTKTALGNLFGFCSIMLGLCMPQIQRLESTWHTLRQKFTDSAFNFEAKLKPTLKSMNDCSNPQAPNTTVPHLLPYVLLRDRGIDDILNPTATNSSLMTSCVTQWEQSASDFGLTILLAHFDSARNFIKNLSLYKRNAQTVLNDQSRLDDLLEDSFRTEFHIKFLWGSKGAFVSAEDRHAKFEQVLTVMAEKYCSVF